VVKGESTNAIDLEADRIAVKSLKQADLGAQKDGRERDLEFVEEATGEDLLNHGCASGDSNRQ
jgi:hypothetical protein